MNQLRSFNHAVAKFRERFFGTDNEDQPVKIDYERGAFPGLTGYHTPIKKAQKSEEAGQWARYDAIVRIIKADFPTFKPEQNKSLVLTEEDGTTEIPLRIESILGWHISSAEWVLACVAEN